MLGLLVVGYFECFGFPVKCAEASWFLQVGFYSILRTGSPYFGVILGPHFGSFLGLDGLNSMFLFWFVSRVLFASIFVELLIVGALETRFS